MIAKYKETAKWFTAAESKKLVQLEVNAVGSI